MIFAASAIAVAKSTCEQTGQIADAFLMGPKRLGVVLEFLRALPQDMGASTSLLPVLLPDRSLSLSPVVHLGLALAGP